MFLIQTVKNPASSTKQEKLINPLPLKNTLNLIMEQTKQLLIKTDVNKGTK
jgi:hypothetical protein